MKLKKTKKIRVIAIAVAATMMVSSLAAGLVGTLASKADKPIRLVQPNGYSVVKADGDTTISATNVSMVDSSDTSIATVSVKDNRYLTITGIKAGTAGIGYGNKVGGVMSGAFQVVNADAITGYNLPNGGNGYVKEPRSAALTASDLGIKYFKTDAPARSDSGVRTPSERTLNLHESNYKRDDTLSSQVEWTSLNTEVVDNNLVPVGKGVTILLGEFTDRWGVKQTIHYLFGVSVIPGDSAMNDLLDAINKGKEIQKDADENPGKYDADKLKDLDNAIKEGERVLEDPSSDDQDYKDAAKDILDAIDALRPGSGGSGESIELIPDKDNNGGPNDKWYRPLKNPKHVYEVVGKDGTPKQPPEYFYDVDRDDDPNTGEKRPAHGPRDGIFYVEDPVGSNIYKPVDRDGNLSDDGAIWGGDDLTFGGGDDKGAVKNNGKWYANLGQNIFQEVNTVTGRLTGKPFGAGADGIPGNSDDLNAPIFLNPNDDKYYAGPFGSGDDQYYIGDKRPAQGGINTKGNGGIGHYDPIDNSDSIYYMNSDGEMVVSKPEAGQTETPIVFGVSIDGPTDVEGTDNYVTFDYTATVSGVNVTDKVNWTVTGITNAAMLPPANSKTSTLRLPPNAIGTVFITATSVDDPIVSFTISVNVKNPTVWANTPKGGEFTADGVEWVVIEKNVGPSGTDMMIMTKYVHSAHGVRWYTTSNGGTTYVNSMFQAAVDTFYGGLGQLHSYAVMPEKLGVAPTDKTLSSGVKAKTETKGVMFPLTVSEIAGFSNALRIGYNVEKTTVPVPYWTRSIYSPDFAYYVDIVGNTTCYAYKHHTQGMRPVMFVNFD